MLEQGTRMHNYLMPQDRAVLEQVQSMSAPWNWTRSRRRSAN